MDAVEILRRFSLAEQERQRLEPIFDDAIRLTMPTRKRFNVTDPMDSAEDIFDETGANAVAEFVSRMQAGLFPPFTDFVKLEASSLIDPRDRKSINADLDQIQEYVFEEIWASNFAQESAETLNDLCMSTGLLQVESGTTTSIRNKAVPITDFYLERGGDDSLCGIFRKRTMKASELEKMYPQMRDDAPKTAGSIKNESDKDLTVIEYVKRDTFASVEKSTHYVVVKENNEIIQKRDFSGRGSTPLIPYRWSTAAGETWGRGPLLNALGAIRTTNLTVELVLENAAMSIVGIYQTDNEGTINADNVQLLPGTILSKEIGTNGLEPVNMATGNFNMRDIVLADQRMNIKRALYNDMLSDPNKTPATATEVAERMADLAHRTSAGFARVFYEMIVPYMWRVLYILEQRGDIELPVKDGRAISFRAVSPLAQAQQGRDLQRLMQDFQTRAMIFGPQAAMASYDIEYLHPWLKKRFGMDEKIHKSAKEILESIERTAEQMQAMQAQGIT